MRIGPVVRVLPLVLLSACASNRPSPMPVASKAGSVPAQVEPRPAIAADPAEAPLDWKRLEAAVAEAARDKRMKVAPDKLHSMAIAYARDINRIPVEDMKQYHIDRASLVLERDVFSGEALAEGAALRATVTGGGGGGGSTRGTRNTTGSSRTSRSSGSTSSSGNSNSNSNRNSSGF
ncbi:MAG: hypothetical protein JNK58_01780 [Phycisphaerae bacterium]|nr:hypothetical protein [Phycisphaerae bacterium]